MMKRHLSLFCLAAALAAPAFGADGTVPYQQNCAVCHGEQRQGGAGPSLADAKWDKVQPNHDALVKFISNGLPASGMPAWKDAMDAKTISAIADYLLAPAAPAAPAGALGKYPELAGFVMPVGFSISVFADQVPSARSMTVAPSGMVFVGSREVGKVYALVTKNNVVERVVTLAQGLNRPIGVAYRDGALYVAEMHRVIRYDDIEKTFDKTPAFKVVRAMPPDGWHGEKVIKFGPDGKLYIPVGAPCNVCNKDKEVYAKIHRMNADGSGFEEVARGIRNSVGMAWHPQTHELWFTDNGRDMLGDNLPSDKLNLAPKIGLHFGFPYCQGGVVPDPEFAAGRKCSEFVAPMAKLGPHVASLGLEFNTGSQFPEQYKNQLFVAEHGSWNRSQKSGYRVALITLVDSQVASDTVFIDGFIQHGQVIGRPVDIAFLPDGSMLVSDDHRGRIYRVTYSAPAKP